MRTFRAVPNVNLCADLWDAGDANFEGYYPTLTYATVPGLI
jgi:hypothetical protein